MITIQDLINSYITILITYIPIYLNLNRELRDIDITSLKNKEDELKYKNRKNELKSVNILYAILLFFILILHILPLETGIYKLLPFKNGYLSDPNFKFSFITGIILAILLFIIFVSCMITIMKDMSLFVNIINIAVFAIVLGFFLIWADNYITLFLTYSIKHNFKFLSIVFNILAYFLLLLISFLIIYILDVFVYNDKKSAKIFC